MKNQKVVRYKQQLDNLFNKISNLQADSEMQSHWARYLCIRVSGFLEVSIRSIYSQYAKDKAAPPVANYIEKQLSKFQNPNMEKILNVARDFNAEWADELQEFIEGEIKDSVVSIVAVRNQIAHGENVGITYIKIKGYYQNAVKLVEFIEQQCAQ
ncbi:MAG: HEPN domain-containing protein [Cyanobacteriota bacterium]|nr:HEPN domain-containing protein [Cyanobacteriota bacterium]